MRQAPLVLVLEIAPRAAAPARAEPPAAPEAPEHVAFGLSFKGVAGCPDEQALRVQVSAWVGYGQVVPKAPALVKLWLERKAGSSSPSSPRSTPTASPPSSPRRTVVDDDAPPADRPPTTGARHIQECRPRARRTFFSVA